MSCNLGRRGQRDISKRDSSACVSIYADVTDMCALFEYSRFMLNIDFVLHASLDDTNRNISSLSGTEFVLCTCLGDAINEVW